MKMRKILSFVLVLSLVLGSFSMAFAATPATGLSDIAGIANEEAVQVNADLGIITGFPDGTFLPEKTVTRAEFAAMITRALAVPESALAGYTSTTFKDTAGYGWAVPYLAFAQSKGIMIGDGMGNAMPGRTINVNEAMTMVLRAVGYVNNASVLVGNWPANYVTVAQNVGLYDDVAATFTVDRANAAQIIYNALTVQKVSVNADGEVTYLTVGSPAKDATLLNTGLGATALDAKVLRGDEDASINLVPYAGAYVVAYEKDDEIIAIGEVKSTFLEGEFDSVDNVFEVGSVDYKGMTTATAITTGGLYIENGDVVSGTTTIDQVSTSSIKIAVDLSSKTIKTLYSISVWVSDREEVVEKADLEAIADNELLGYKFIENDNDEIDFNSFELIGAASLDKIAVDNVVYVYVNNDSKIKKVAVGTEVVSGKVVELDDGKFTINGKKYEIADESTEAVPGVGDTITAKLDAYGYVFDYKVDSTEADKYGIVKAYAPVGINDAQVKLYTSEDATTTFNIDDEAVTTSTTGVTIGGVGNLMGYGLNKDGKIETINLEVVTSAAAELASAKVLTTSEGSYSVASDVVVFTNAAGGYDVTTIDKVKTGESLIYAGEIQFILDTDKVVAMVVAASATGKTDTDLYAVVNKVVVALDADDDPIQRITGFGNGAALDKYTDGANDITLTKTAVTLYKLELNVDGVVTTTTVKAVDATVNGATTIAALNSDKTAVKVGDNWYALADGVKVYATEKDSSNNYSYTLSSNSSLREGYKIWLFELDNEVDGYEVVVFAK